MNLVSTLAAGIAAAPLGTAEVYLRGTSTRATVYYTFEGATPDSSGDDIDLDSYGSVEVYVNALVDVVVRNADNTIVRTFTEGHSAPLVEVRSSAFTGINYDTLASAAGNPTTLQSVLDRWLTSAGSIDWNVLMGGVPTSIEDGFGALAGFVYNVKSPAYGAVGDGVADDQAAIAAALAAAVAAGGGVVFVPRGTYLISTAIEWDHRVSLVGIGARQSIIKSSSAVNARIITLTAGTAAGSPILISGIAFDATQANTGEQFYSTVAVNVRFVGCSFGVTANCAGNLVRTFTNGGKLTFSDCDFTAYTGFAVYLAADCILDNCRFFAGTTNYNQEIVRLDSVSALVKSFYSVVGCTFDASAVLFAGGDLRGIRMVSVNAQLTMSACHFVSTSQIFTSGIRLIAVGMANVYACSFSGCALRYDSTSATIPLAAGSSLDVHQMERQAGSGTAYTVANCVDFCEINTTGTVPTITMPAKLFRGQRLTLVILNTSGALWLSNVTFTGAQLYGTTGTDAPNNTVVVAEFIVSDVAVSGTYTWIGTSVKIGSA